MGVDEPDIVREDAQNLESLGKTFGVDTQEGQRRLDTHADNMEQQIEEHRERDWDGESGYGGGSGGSECSDGELDSMFATLSE